MSDTINHFHSHHGGETIAAIRHYLRLENWYGGELPEPLKQVQDIIEGRGSEALAKAWSEGHAAGRDYQADGWNSDTHNPEHDNPYRSKT